MARIVVFITLARLRSASIGPFGHYLLLPPFRNGQPMPVCRDWVTAATA